MYTSVFWRLAVCNDGLSLREVQSIPAAYLPYTYGIMADKTGISSQRYRMNRYTLLTNESAHLYARFPKSTSSGEE
jgi:hypothetical protein